VNPTSMGLWGRFGEVWYRVREFYFSSRRENRQLTDEEYADALENLAGGREIRAVIVDPSAASFQETLRRRGLRVRKADNDVLWIQTNYGLDRFDTRRQTIQSFKDFKYINRMAISPEDDFFIIKDDGYIYYYQPEQKDFCKLDVKKIHFEEVQQMAIDNFGVLWIFSSDNDNRSYIIEKNGNQVKLVPSNCLNHSEKLLWTFVDGDFLYFIDSTYALYEYDLNNHKAYFIADMEAEILRRGEVSSIIKQKTDYFIGFKSSGLIQLKYMPDSKVKYSLQSINVQSGIFCLMKDRFQDIIWVGADGQGLYMYFTDEFSIDNIMLDVPEYRVDNPVRALYQDQDQTLWIGTKGGGIS